MSIAVGGLPTKELAVGQVLYRIHRSENEPWFFSGTGEGRFDPSLAGKGACYLSTSKLGAWVETFRTAMVIDEADVRARSIATVTLNRSIVCVDLSRRRALAAGVTAAMTSGGDYDPPQALADQLQGDLDGLLWRVRHDLAQQLIGVALFGPEGEQGRKNWPPVEIAPIDGDLIREAEDKFGYRVMPAGRKI